MAKWKIPEGRRPMTDADIAALTRRLAGTAVDYKELYEAAKRDAEEAEAYAAELEAKLAKAVELAEKYQHAFAAQSRKLQAVLHIDGVRATLAELKGINQ